MKRPTRKTSSGAGCGHAGGGGDGGRRRLRPAACAPVSDRPAQAPSRAVVVLPAVSSDAGAGTGAVAVCTSAGAAARRGATAVASTLSPCMAAARVYERTAHRGRRQHRARCPASDPAAPDPLPPPPRRPARRCRRRIVDGRHAPVRAAAPRPAAVEAQAAFADPTAGHAASHAARRRSVAPDYVPRHQYAPVLRQMPWCGTGPTGSRP